MQQQSNLQIVIDACVGRRANETGSEYEKAEMCGICLSLILEHGYFMVMNDTIETEWRQRISKFSVRWLRSMFSLNRIHISSFSDIHTREIVLNLKTQQSVKESIKRDLHLLDAALDTHKRIISVDNKARKLFRKHLVSICVQL